MRISKRLRSLTLERAKLPPGRHADGDNLYLVVDKSGARRWTFIYRWREPGRAGPGRLREMGLGSVKKVGLTAAREKAADARALLGRGVDPIAHAKAQVPMPTFGEVADEWVEKRSAELRSDKSKARLKRALKGYAAKLRPLRVDAIKTADIVDVLKPDWEAKSHTAKGVRGYIEAVLDAAKARGWRSGENPARWKGHLDNLLPRQQRLKRGHHAAMPYTQLPAFLGSLRLRDATAARALEFLILGACRTGEVLGARWSEIDLPAKVWTVPADRMKAGREHRVPLSPRMIEILNLMDEGRTGKLVFAGRRKGDEDRPLSNMAFEMLLRRMGAGDYTTHGFRSAFRDWVAEMTSFPPHLAEAALAHTVGDATERAYRRGDVLEKRRKLMNAWGRFCGVTAAVADAAE